MLRNARLIALMAMFSLASISAFGQTGDKAKVKGMINSRTGDTFIVDTTQGNVTVVLTTSTKTKDNKGLLGARTETLAREVLAPGLKVDVDGKFDDRGHVVATAITIDGDDLEMSRMIQAGLTPTAKQVATNTERIAALELHLAAVERMAAGASAQTPAPTEAAPPPPASTQAPAPAQATAPAAEPASAPFGAPKTSVDLLRVGGIFLFCCCIALIAVRRGKVNSQVST